MNEDKLKRELEKHRKGALEDEEGWKILLEMGAVGDALEKDFEEEMIAYIVEQHDRVAAGYSGGGGRGGRPPGQGGKGFIVQNFEPELSAYEIERGAAYAEYLAKVVSVVEHTETTYGALTDDFWPRRLSVDGYRRQILDGRTLTPEEARVFLGSPAAAHFSAGDFESYHIPQCTLPPPRQ